MKQRQEQTEFWIAHTELPRTVAHPFFERLNQLLEERGFDEFVEQQLTEPKPKSACSPWKR